MGETTTVKAKAVFEVMVGESLALETPSKKAAFELAQFQAARGAAVVVRRTVELLRTGGTV